MNCKSFRELLPELASDEVIGKQAQEAKEHISACHSCADEFEAYKKAMDALSSPHAVFDAPSRLTMPVLPQKRSRRWGYLIPTAAAAFIISLMIMLLNVRHTPDVQVAVQPDQSARVNASTQPMIKPPAISGSQPNGKFHQKPSSVVMHKSLVFKRNPTVKMAKHKIADSEHPMMTASGIQDVNANIDTHIIHSDKELPKKSGFVIVSRNESQPESRIEIRSVNVETGATTSYSARTDSDGNKQSMLITSSKVAEDNGRDTL